LTQEAFSMANQESKQQEYIHSISKALLQISTRGPPIPKIGSETGVGTAFALAAFCDVSSSSALQKLLSQCGLPFSDIRIAQGLLQFAHLLQDRVRRIHSHHYSASL
jgi:hypothetical protein